MSWTPKSFDKEVIKPVSLIKEDWKDLDILDTTPKKTIAQQVFDIMQNSERLESYRLSSLNAIDVPDSADLDELDTGIDEYSDPYEIDQAISRLSNSLDRLKSVKAKKQSEPVNDSPVKDGSAPQSSDSSKESTPPPSPPPQG